MMSPTVNIDKKYHVFLTSETDFFRLVKLLDRENRNREIMRDKLNSKSRLGNISIVDLITNDIAIIFPNIIMKNKNEWTIIVVCPFCSNHHQHDGGSNKNPITGRYKSLCNNSLEYEIILNDIWSEKIEKMITDKK